MTLTFSAWAAGVIGPEVATEIVRVYAGAKFSNAERHLRRLNKVLGFEADFSK